MKKCFIFDIDGTLADASHRLPLISEAPKDWNGFYEACDRDPCIEPVKSLATCLMGMVPLIFVTGRPEKVRTKTGDWLVVHGLYGELYMRGDSDFRPDYILKKALLEEVIADGWEPIMAFEDRDQVVAMWREAGIMCAQVAPGSY